MKFFSHLVRPCERFRALRVQIDRAYDLARRRRFQYGAFLDMHAREQRAIGVMEHFDRHRSINPACSPWAFLDLPVIVRVHCVVQLDRTETSATVDRCDADADPTVETAGSAHIESGLFHTHIHWARGSAQSRSSTAADNFRNVCQSSAAGVTERYSRQIRVKAARSGPGERL